jgi:peptidyl-tRNA hydrolase
MFSDDSTFIRSLLWKPACRIDPYLTHYAIIRSNLPIGFAAAQIVHAADESTSHNLTPGTFAVVLSVDSEDELKQLGQRLVSAAIPHVYIREPDPPYFGQLTAIGIAPTNNTRAIKRITGNLPLYGKERKLAGAV